MCFSCLWKKNCYFYLLVYLCECCPHALPLGCSPACLLYCLPALPSACPSSGCPPPYLSIKSTHLFILKIAKNFFIFCITTSRHTPVCSGTNPRKYKTMIQCFGFYAVFYIVSSNHLENLSACSLCLLISGNIFS